MSTSVSPSADILASEEATATVTTATVTTVTTVTTITVPDVKEETVEAEVATKADATKTEATTTATAVTTTATAVTTATTVPVRRFKPKGTAAALKKAKDASTSSGSESDRLVEDLTALTGALSIATTKTATATTATNTTDTLIDTYTPEILTTRFNSHKAYVTETKALILKLGNIPIRLPNMPEDISENIAKFMIHYWVGDKTSKWTKGIVKKGGTKIPGDLISTTELAQEVKCFTSDGPPTFGPTEHWDVIYFLDARLWLEDRFALWRVPLTNTSKEWKAIKVNSKETYDDHCRQGRRPRITWEGIYPQIKDHCSKVFEGTFAQIFTAKV